MTVATALVDAATLPLRLGVAFTRTTLQLGRLTAADGPMLRPGGYGERLDVLRELTSPDRPLGRLLAEGGLLDRLVAEDGALERLLGVDGALDQLVAEGGALDRLLAAGGALDRITAPGGVLDRILQPGGLADRMLTDDGFVEKLIAEGGTLDQLVALGDTLESIRPRLVQLAELIPELAASVDALDRSVTPLGELANRLPLSRRRLGASS
jgi:hypothetical protein